MRRPKRRNIIRPRQLAKLPVGSEIAAFEIARPGIPCPKMETPFELTHLSLDFHAPRKLIL
jgi:hypothetical protein